MLRGLGRDSPVNRQEGGDRCVARTNSQTDVAFFLCGLSR
jgi:hypothetical protein